ncbi:iron-containing alcohol dehydrogenase [Vibrio splendidus]
MNRKSYTIEKHESKSLNYIFSDNIFNKYGSDLTNFCLENGFDDLQIVVDENVYGLHEEMFLTYQHSYKLKINYIILPINSSTKSMGTVIDLLNKFSELDIVRGSALIAAIGGGTLMDVVSFAASIYHRKIDHIRIPTTLLGIVDAGHGIKNGINYDGVKNRVGSYSAPLTTFVNKSFLKTLPANEIENGLGEVLKIGISNDPYIIQLLAESPINTENFLTNDNVKIDNILNRAIDALVYEISLDPWEKSHKRALDLGHIISPYLESITGWSINHGVAVASECLFSTIYAFYEGILSEPEYKLILVASSNCNLIRYYEFYSLYEEVLKAFEQGSKHRGGSSFFPYPKAIGSLEFIDFVKPNDVNKMCLYYETKFPRATSETSSIAYEVELYV